MPDEEASSSTPGAAASNSAPVAAAASGVDAEARENGGVKPTHGRTMNEQKKWFLQKAKNHASKGAGAKQPVYSGFDTPEAPPLALTAQPAQPASTGSTAVPPDAAVVSSNAAAVDVTDGAPPATPSLVGRPRHSRGHAGEFHLQADSRRKSINLRMFLTERKVAEPEVLLERRRLSQRPQSIVPGDQAQA